ncbi:MAG: dockerin type I domain-containing protein, partial [Planctomycetota bacterium]
NAGEFDLYVGLTGNGVLLIADGGRSEIRDGAFFGVAPIAVGRVSVDGQGSYLGIYGMYNPFSTAASTPDQQTLIGVYGDGMLEITGGARVDSFNRAALGAIDAAGMNGDAFQRGGSGAVTVSGAGSVWRVLTPNNDSSDNDAAGIAIGEYYEDGDQEDRINRLFTFDEAYRADDGRGTLTISDGGLVTVQEGSPAGTAPGADNQIENASVRIGRYGVLELRGGRIDVADRLDNDGLIRTGDTAGGIDRYGDGEIDAGSFLNSPLGQVRVRASEYLRIRSDADDATTDPEMITAGATTTAYYFANAGQIEVLGDQAIGKAEIEFDRELDALQNGTPEDDRFRNLILVDVPVAAGMGAMATQTIRGQIKAQDANLFFRSGLLNEGDLDFVGGDNVVTGEVENAATGRIIITNESHVTFQNSVTNAGVIVLNDESDVAFLENLVLAPPPPVGLPNLGAPSGGSLIDLNPAAITVGGDLEVGGSLDFVIGGGLNGLDFTRMGVAGDATFAATSTITIDDLSLTGVVDGSSYDLITVAGTVTDDGLMTLSLPTAPAGLAFVPRVFDPLFDAQKYILDVVAVSPMVVGADFNGDGMVDAADVAIWVQFNGLQSGATGLLGDADGDGDVDARDGQILNMQLGGPPVVTGALLAGFTVPEPSAAVLMMLSLATAAVRRRRLA